MIKFLLNQHLIILDEYPADQTVLDYLREQQHLCGTKEGCASGDCGACTVVLASAEDNTLKYRAINSCITFLGSLHGKQLLTVEHLAKNDTLHPVQQAMVNHHGSQCGFCTPGFVMSMFALYKDTEQAYATNDPKDPHQAVHQSLAGNLCRCTGYRPIIDAALEATKNPTPDQFNQTQQATLETLRALQQEDQQHETPIGPQQFFIPTSLRALSNHYLNHPTARLLGGGTDLALEVTQQLKSIDQIILLNRVAELQQINIQQNTIEIGAAVSLTRCDQLFTQYYPTISELLQRFGATQVRNQGTIGGNIANASPIGDLPPVLIALNAQLTLQKGDQTRTILLQDFFLDYKKTALDQSEFIRTIILPLPTKNQHLAVYKISKRIDDDISAVCMAINAQFETPAQENANIHSIRIALGGMAATAKRAENTEQQLNQKTLSQANIKHAQAALSKEFTPISDARASANYRLQLAQNLLQRFYQEMTNPAQTTQVTHVDAH